MLKAECRENLTFWVDKVNAVRQGYLQGEKSNEIKREIERYIVNMSLAISTNFYERF